LGWDLGTWLNCKRRVGIMRTYTTWSKGKIWVLIGAELSKREPVREMNNTRGERAQNRELTSATPPS